MTERKRRHDDVHHPAPERAGGPQASAKQTDGRTLEERDAAEAKRQTKLTADFWAAVFGRPKNGG